MAIGASMHTFTVQLADVDRGVYEELSLRLAKHPSETDAYLLTRLIAYALEYEEGIAFSEGISATDEPAVIARDATGAITAWIEVGAPDASRLHTGSMRADRVAVYTHRDPEKVIAGWRGKRIHEAAAIPVRGLDPAFLDTLGSALERRNDLTLSLVEGELYAELNGHSASATLTEHRIE